LSREGTYQISHYPLTKITFYLFLGKALDVTFTKKNEFVGRVIVVRAPKSLNY